ncbi:Uncharacterised protein [Streptococcus suis]|uniref:Uncharacterized protein n=9 Tax=Streptococcus suis TaxID=1307 RepID=A0AB37G5W0_STRSU|nr:hypothetical protein [Streptococcus suis]AEB81087.1 hypothetical protein SSUST3_0626 [Streptococcus suis ST3]ALA29167.1 hypothetical protein AA105_07950 [Streptococcus suis]AML46055.1 hypothetical protein APQ97_02900 [Streptococcus suis]AMU78862.1 hypothetical protein AN924_03090 [Streptococcus suis]ASW52105.1 hypothetical protein A7J09_08215 [Streptococcus suis]
MEVIKCIRLEKEFAGCRGWAKSLTSLLRVRVNISAQWLIGRFVRVLHSKSDLTIVANKVRFISNLKLSPRQFELCGGGSETVWG